jgi:hypothetical protein
MNNLLKKIGFCLLVMCVSFFFIATIAFQIMMWAAYLWAVVLIVAGCFCLWKLAESIFD